MAVIEIKNLSFSYGEHLILNDISFNIGKGEYVSIIGHNGSGKSTIAKLLIGLISKSKGELKSFGLEYNNKNIQLLRKRIGIVFQNPDNQFIGNTVRDDIAFGLENRLVPQEEMDGIITNILKEVDMSDFIDKEPHNLSGGQKQRVAIAGVLALTPDILILDEATSMLDPKGKREINEIIAKMKKNNQDLTVISITHDIEEAFKSDKIIVLNKGSIYFHGSPNELIEKNIDINSIGLSLPFFYLLKNKLIEDKIITNEIKNIQELVDYLCQ